MQGLVEQIRRFNRKERFYLVGQALGNPRFQLSDEFRKAVEGEAGLTIPGDAFVAMDYHLNWVHAAVLICSGSGGAPFAHETDVKTAGNQEDADLLIAFDDGPVTHLILIEAKGATAWNPRQLRSKAGRLTSVFGDDGTKPISAHLHFVFASPGRPKLPVDPPLPKWMVGPTRWIELRLPPGLERITRCDIDGRIGKLGTYWKVVPAPVGSSSSEDEA